MGRARRALGHSPRYLAWRLDQELRHRLQRLTLRAARGGRGPLSRSAILGGLGEQGLARTRVDASMLGEWRSAVHATGANAALRADVVRRADLAERRVVQLFGDEAVAVGCPPAWNVDVRSGFGWPLAHYTTIDYRNLNRPSDVKVTWELSRLRHLVHLAQGYALTSELRYGAALSEDLRSWHLRNPLGRSVNWTCAMEVALRALNLICVDAILLTRGPEYPDRRLMVSSLYQHGWFLDRNLEISDVNGNHFLADAVGLVWLGRYFGDFGEAPRWLARGCDMVAEAAAQQVLADGLDHEGSLPYHLLVTEMFLLARHAAADALRAIDPTLHAMLHALCAVVHPDGRVPDLGDDDGGRVAAFGDTPSGDARRVLALGSALLGHTAAAAKAAGGPCDDALWLRGPTALGERQSPAGPSVSRRHFETAGVIVLGESRDRVVIDAGPVGFRGRGGHGHLDAMSFEAVLGGHVAVRDLGPGATRAIPPYVRRCAT